MTHTWTERGQRNPSPRMPAQLWRHRDGKSRGASLTGSSLRLRLPSNEEPGSRVLPAVSGEAQGGTIPTTAQSNQPSRSMLSTNEGNATQEKHTQALTRASGRRELREAYNRSERSRRKESRVQLIMDGENRYEHASTGIG